MKAAKKAARQLKAYNKAKHDLMALRLRKFPRTSARRDRDVNVCVHLSQFWVGAR